MLEIDIRRIARNLAAMISESASERETEKERHLKAVTAGRRRFFFVVLADDSCAR